jgi:hypothetical protein
MRRNIWTSPCPTALPFSGSRGAFSCFSSSPLGNPFVLRAPLGQCGFEFPLDRRHRVLIDILAEANG